MELSIIVLFFIVGSIFGSFYNVVGYRLPNGESLLFPSSHCTKCKHKLTPLELIPIFSFIFLGGKCKKCREKISLFYPVIELSSGVLFALCYIRYGFSVNCLISIVFISMLLIIIVSDYLTMIIPDSVLIFFGILILLIRLIFFGIQNVAIALVQGVCAFLFMLILKKLGDFLFKKESMGGGDIKLLGVFGITIGFFVSVVAVFLSAFIALPISLITLKKNSTHEIPFGPYLAISAIILVLLGLDIDSIKYFITI